MGGEKIIRTMLNYLSNAPLIVQPMKQLSPLFYPSPYIPLFSASRHSSAVKRCATLLLRTAVLMARRLPASTHNLRARVIAV
jgi:hypothetical protein